MKLIQQAMPEAPFYFEKVQQPQIEEPRQLCPWHSGNPPAASPQGILKQLWALNRVWEFAVECVPINAQWLVIRVRQDSLFMELEMPREERWLNPEFLHECLTPAWSRWGGVNDRFAVMGADAAFYYFGTFRQREELWKKWCPLHPETMIGFNLAYHGIRPDNKLAANFCTLRMPDARHPDYWIDPQTVNPMDLLHVAGS